MPFDLFFCILYQATFSNDFHFNTGKNSGFISDTEKHLRELILIDIAMFWRLGKLFIDVLHIEIKESVF